MNLGKGMGSIPERHVRLLVVILFLAFVLLSVTLQGFAQYPSVTGTPLNPLLVEIQLLAQMIKTLSSPFSSYAGDPYSSYSPFDLPYATIPRSPDFNAFPFSLTNALGNNTFYKPYEVYNPVSYLRTGFPDLSAYWSFFPPFSFPQLFQDQESLPLSSPFIFPLLPNTLPFL